MPISVKRFFLGLIFVLAVSSCQQTDAVPVPQTNMRVEISSTLLYLTPAIQACAVQEQGLHIILEEKPAREMAKTGAEVSLRWGATGVSPTNKIFRLGADRLLFAANRNNPVETLTISQANLLGRGLPGAWTTIFKESCPECQAPSAFLEESPEVWKYPPGEDIALEMAEIPTIDKFAAAGRTWIAPTPRDLADAISNNPGAVGWLPARWLNEDLKEIPLTGVNPLDTDIPVVAITSGTPSQTLQNWLLCLQSSYAN